MIIGGNFRTLTSTGLQRPGAVGFVAYASDSSTKLPVGVDVDGVWAGPAGTQPDRN